MSTSARDITAARFTPPGTAACRYVTAGAYGENVRDPEVAPALKRGLEQIRRGIPAVIVAAQDTARRLSQRLK